MSMADVFARVWRKLRGQDEDPHQEQLMRLYWNRAELKKELSNLQEERHGLLAKLDAQQATLKRATEQVEELAAYLGRPAVFSVASAVARQRQAAHELCRGIAATAGGARAPASCRQ
jgi:hypothetical protein